MSSLNNYKADPLSTFYDRVRTNQSKKLSKLLLRYLPRTAKVLEIGPGHGHFAREMRNVGFTYDAIEPSDLYRNALLSENFTITNEPVPPINRESDTYDLVHASMLIENLPTSLEAAEFACEAARVLRPNGLISLVFPNYLTWGSFFFDEHYSHSFETTPRRVSHLLISQGFTIVKTEYTLGWFWVEGSFFKNVLRHTINILMRVVHMPIARWTAHYIGLGELHWKVRKTLFEGVILIAKKQLTLVR